MNIKNKTYMKRAEFKARQLWLPFSDAVGIVLEIMEECIVSARQWFKRWARKPRVIAACSFTDGCVDLFAQKNKLTS